MTWGGKARWMLTLAWRWWWLLVWWCGSGYMTRAMEPLFIGCTRPCLSVGGKSWIPDIQIIKGVFFKRHPEVGRRARAFRGPEEGSQREREREPNFDDLTWFSRGRCFFHVKRKDGCIFILRIRKDLDILECLALRGANT
jgi:hypothetical protein